MESADDLLCQWVERLRREEPHAVAILCHGSYARGEAERHSDLDLDVLFEDNPEVEYRSAFGELPDGRLLHATIENKTLRSWLEAFDNPEPSESWAFFLQARLAARLLWATPEARALFENRITLVLPASAEFQDFIDDANKVRNAALRGDELGVRLAAQGLALRCPALLGLINEPTTVDSPRTALQAALNLKIVTANYRDDLLLCLGLSGSATSTVDIHDAALRLAFGTLQMLGAHAEEIGDHLEPGLAAPLADGKLLRLLTQR